ncbi:MAG: hypothetical protein LBF58_05935 [Deltaproteobacteria bacterium]|jgi:hypothetical protein|nr:hypothetical protein [Deltaproteobacteria bacterium]
MFTIFRILVLAILFYLIFWVIRGLVAPRQKGQTVIKEEELVKDALTGIYFPVSKAVVVNKHGQKLYFSSVANRDLWLRQDGQTK